MQKQPRRRLRIVDAPVALPADFPVTGGHPHEQGDAPIAYLHKHDCLEVGCCYAGSGIFIIGDRVFPFQEGDVTVIPAGDVHLARSTPGTRSHWAWVYLDPWRLAGPLVQEADFSGMRGLAEGHFLRVISPQRDPLVGTLARELVHELRHRPRAHRAAVKGLVWSLLIRWHRLAPARARRRRAGDENALRRVAPALDFMAQAYDRPSTAAEWARRCHCSLTHFRRLFRSAVGKSPCDYLTELRICMATSHLRATDKKIVVIAHEVGFATLSSFNRAFRRVLGVSPREWRAQMRQTSAPS